MHDTLASVSGFLAADSVHGDGRQMATHATRRGRRSHDDYLEAIIALVRADVWTLKEQETFADALGVKALAAQFASEAWPLGIALHLLIAGAVADVGSVASAAQTRASTRVSEFLRLWYYDHCTVASIATDLQLSRSHVAETVQRPALLLVAQRFLSLAHQVDPHTESRGLQQALATFQRRQAASALGWCATPACQLDASA
jgi:hypothetical protein